MENKKCKKLLETESFKASSIDDEKLQKEIEKQTHKDLKIKYGDTEFSLVGFDVVKDDKDNVVFAYKPKGNDFVTYYKTEKTDEEWFKTFLKEMESAGIQTQDIMEQIKNVYLNKKHIEYKLGENK